LNDLLRVKPEYSSLVANFGIDSSERSFEVDLAPEGPFNLVNESYDAYERDIAIVDFYFQVFLCSQEQTFLF
jgi:hypothetical protein